MDTEQSWAEFNEQDREARLRRELAETKAAIAALEVPISQMCGMTVRSMPLAGLLGDKVNVRLLKAAEARLKKASISDEAREWLAEAIANLEEFTRYANGLELKLYARLDELVAALEEA